MATSKIPGGLYIGVDGKYHDADGKPIPDEVVRAALGTAEPLPEETPAPVLVFPEAPELKVKKKKKG